MKFGHHDEPAEDFIAEVEAIAVVAGEPGADLPALRERVAKAMDFRVGGRPDAVDAKHRLREIERRIAPLGPETEKLLGDFAGALRAKLVASEVKYGWHDNWKYDDWEEDCRLQMRKHIEKGDPLDVAAFCAFLWARGWPTSGPTGEPPDREAALKIAAKGDKVLRDLHDVVMSEQTGSRSVMSAAEAAIMEIVRLRVAPVRPEMADREGRKAS